MGHWVYVFAGCPYGYPWTPSRVQAACASAAAHPKGFSEACLAREADLTRDQVRRGALWPNTQEQRRLGRASRMRTTARVLGGRAACYLTRHLCPGQRITWGRDFSWP